MLIGLADFEEVTHDRIVRFRAGMQRRIVAATRHAFLIWLSAALGRATSCPFRDPSRGNNVPRAKKELHPSRGEPQ
jgi:hypothetical protein